MSSPVLSHAPHAAVDVMSARRAPRDAVSLERRPPSRSLFARFTALFSRPPPPPPGPWALPQLAHPAHRMPDIEPVYIHSYPCPCFDGPSGHAYRGPCVFPPSAANLELCAALELAHDDSCHALSGPMFHDKHGLAKCVEVDLWAYKLDPSPVGTTLPRSFFSGSPQEHAILNRHLLDYFKGRERSQQTTPYAIPASQVHLLADLGMELPQPDAPECPHALHKSIEEGQLRRMRQWLPAENYGLVSVKASKQHLLPPAASVQNPAYQAKDVSRYPGAAVRSVTFANHSVHLLHDVSSEVPPHELAERLDQQNPNGHLFITGMNPIEVLDRTSSFEPASHEIDYDLDGFNFVFTGSPSESYFTPVSTTVAWLRSSSVRTSSGRVYHVVLLDYKLGHCVWHIFSGDVEEQHTRTFGTGSYVRLPAVVTGTWRDEWLPTKVLTGILAFTDRTPDLSTRNLSAKVTQLATSITPRLTSREQWIAAHIASRRVPVKTWDYLVTRSFWSAMYVLSFQWHLLSPIPDLYAFVDERRRFRTIHPTPGGGWVLPPRMAWKRDSIPNNPSALQRVSALTSSVFTFLIPKILIGEAVSNIVMHVPLWSLFSHVYRWADLQPLRVALTVSIVVVTAILPGHVIKVFSRLAGHFWRQLWLPAWLNSSVERAITEACGGPGARWLMFLPGRGWAFQAYLWTVGLLSILPGLIPHCVLPTALLTGHFWVPALWFALIAWENSCAIATVKPFAVPPAHVHYWFNLADWWQAFLASDWQIVGNVPLWVCLGRSAMDAGFTLRHWIVRFVNWSSVCIAPPECDLRSLPAFTNLPPLPAAAAPTVRRRNVDVQLPAVQVQPHQIPTGQQGVTLAVSPSGLEFHEWVQAVERAYTASTVRYPTLTPGQSCFWDCVATFGGTPHMWYSWFMAYTGRVPDAADPVVGNVNQALMLMFAAASGFGMTFTGLCTDVVHSTGAGWPTINMRLSHSTLRGTLHVEIAKPTPSPVPQANLARILRTLRQVWPGWDLEFQNALNAAPLDSVPQPTPTLVAMAGAMDLPTTRTALVDALLGSFACRPIQAVQQEGFAIDFARQLAAPFPELFEHNQPTAGMAVGAEAPAGMWRRFRQFGKPFRIRVPTSWAPPCASEPGPRIGHSPTAAQSKHNSRTVATPTPPQWLKLQAELADRLRGYEDLTLPAVPLACENLAYTADLGRACRLVSDLKAHPSVLESFANVAVLQSLDSVLDSYRMSGKTVSVPVRCYAGVWGCGKTTATKAYLTALPPDERRQARVVSHTESLRAQAKAALDFPELRGFNFPTMASILTEPTTGPVVFDDAGKFWGGVLDLVILANPLLSEVVVNGDPAQGMAKFPVAGTQSEYDPSPLAAIAPLITRYATVTHRGFGLLANSFGVHTTNAAAGHISHTNEPLVALPVCTASPRYAGVLAAGGRQAYTYASVQGEDFKTDMEIDLTGLEGSMLDRSAYVALTRSSTGVYVHMDAMDPTSRLNSLPTGSAIMNALICAVRAGATGTLTAPSPLVKAAFYRHLAWCMPSLTWFAAVGSSVPASAYQNVFPAVHTHFPVDAFPAAGAAADWVVQAGPPADELVREVHFHAKEDREAPGRGGATNQFKDVAFVNPHDHKRSDTATYFLSVQARLTTASAKANASRMESCPRTDLIEEYDRLVPAPPQWTALKHEVYCERAVHEYSRTRSFEAIMAKIRAHDPDRTASDIVISLKNQVIKKEEKRTKKEAIPGQLIHEYDLSHTLNDAAFALFLEDEIIPAFPANFLFYRRMSPDQFIAEYKARWRVNNGVHTSDVTRWDVGCDAGVLNFDAHLMRRSGLPSSYVDAYVHRRLTARSQHGPMATMQNSGDRFTWPLNSVRRAVVASLINHVQPEDTVAINGDDEAIDRFCESDHFPDSPWLFKNQNGLRGEFSGFELGSHEPEYSARGIQYRTMILESRDPSAQNKWLNYLGLLQHANPDTTEAADVARSAHRHMRPELFATALPRALRGLFPEVSF